MNKFVINFKRLWMWFFRWPSWLEIALAVVLLIVWLHLVVEPLGNIGEFLGCFLGFLIMSGLWGVHLIYRLILLLPFMVRKFGRPYAGTQPVKMAIFRWAFWPVVAGLIILAGWQKRPIQRAGFEVWRYKFQAIAESENPGQFSDRWIGWYNIHDIYHDTDDKTVRFDSDGEFFNSGGFLYSPDSKPVSEENYEVWPLSEGWYIWRDDRWGD